MRLITRAIVVREYRPLGHSVDSFGWFEPYRVNLEILYFCQIVAQQAPASIIYEDELCLALMDIFRCGLPMC